MENKLGGKLLISGKSASGKTTMISGLKNAMVIVVDEKVFPFEMAHYKYTKFDGLSTFKEELISKLKAYKSKYGERVETVVFDTITHMYMDMHIWSVANNKGFDIFNAMQTAVLELNAMIESLLIHNGVNVVIVAHTTFNEGTMSYDIPSMGQFKNSGGWLSVVDNATHICAENNKRKVYNSSLKYPSRSTVDVPDLQGVDDYDIQKHIELIKESANKSDSHSL